MRSLLLVSALSFLVLSATAAGAELYAVVFEEGADLTTLEDAGARVRHIGTSTAIVEADTPGALRALDRPGALGLGTLSRGERVYVCYPRSSSQALTGHGRVLWTETDGALIIAVRRDRLDALRAASFHVHALPDSLDAAAWFEDTPAPLVGTRPRSRERQVRGLVEDVLSSVSTDSLMAHVERLSAYPGGDLRSRYTRREECLTEAKPYIVDRLEWYLPVGASIDSQRFYVLGYSCDDDTLVVEYPADNIIGTLTGTGRLGGYYIVGAHYDAIASHSFPTDSMWWCDNPAPGADDNATGVAVALEAARVLSGLSFPFDIRFIFFTGEELGLLGSIAYADSVAALGDTIYGVLNVDMLAYKPEDSAPDTCHIVTNRGTTWLADWIVETAELYSSHFDDWNVMRIDQALAYSDHASFWFKGYDGLVAIEHWNPRKRNPYYHTTEDTLGSLSPSQLAGVGRVVAGSVARLAETDGTINLAVFPEDLAVSPSSPETGDVVEMSVKVHVFGPDEMVDMTLEVWDGAPDEGELLSSYEAARVMGGGEVIYHEFYWLPDSEDLGLHEVTLLIETEGIVELTVADNEAVAEIRVNDANRLFVMDHYTYPNPAGDEGDLGFRYELSREAAAAEVQVFDITGQELGLFQKGISLGEPGEESGTSPGWNTVHWSAFGGPAPDLASGVYIYKLRIYERDVIEPVDEVTGRFAVVR